MAPTLCLCQSPQTHDPTSAAFEDLPLRGVRWALAGGRAALRPGARDVDLVVDRRDLRSLERVLRAHGFVRRIVRGPNRLYVAYDEQQGSWHVLDIATHVRVGPHVVDAGRLLDRRRQQGPFFVLDPGDAFWLRMLELLTGDEAVLPGDRAELQQLGRRADASSDLARLATWWSPEGWMAATLRAAVLAGEWESLADACRRCRPRASSPGAALVDAVERPLVRLGRRLRRFRPRRGLSLAIVGPDGAGKSTLASRLVADFGLPARVFYMGLHAPVGGAAPHTGGARPRRPLPIRIRRQSRRLQRLLRTAFVAELARAQGRLVVFDRYTHDADVQWRQAGGLGAHLRRWLVTHAARQPDIVVVLDVPADVMFARKGEHTPTVLEERRLGYLALAEGSDRFAIVDGTRSPEEVSRAVTGLAWRRYVELCGSGPNAGDGLRARRQELRRGRGRAHANGPVPPVAEAPDGMRRQS